jgi:uncharacterized membrane protein YjjP (DUF1212 family)
VRLRRRHPAQASRPQPAADDATHSPIEAYRVLDLALRAGEIFLAGGAGASDVTATILAITNACGLRRVECDITFTSISVSCQPSPGAPPVTGMRLVRRRSLDYTRVTEVHNLVQDLVDGRIDQETAEARLRTAARAPHPYRRWSVALSRALLAAAVGVLLGGGLIVVAAAFLATLLADRINRALDAREVPEFYQNVFGGVVATGVAIGLVAVDADVRPSLVVAAGIVLLLPGVTLVGAVQDAITGFLVTASARAFETFLLTAGIISGVAVALSLGVRLDVPVRITAPPPVGLSDVPLQIAAAAVVSGAFAVSTYSPRRTIPAAAAAGAIGWAAFSLANQLELDTALSTALAAVLVGLGSHTFAYRQKVPALLYIAAGIIPLLPGLTIYRGMFRSTNGDSIGGITTLGQAVSIGLALAAGVILGQFLAQPARREVGRIERRIAGPRLAGPLRRRRRGGDSDH